MIGDAMQAWHDPKYIDMEIEKHLACSAMGHDWGIAKYYHRSTLVLPMTDDPNERATFIGLPVLKVRICERCGYREEKERTV